MSADSKLLLAIAGLGAAAVYFSRPASGASTQKTSIYKVVKDSTSSLATPETAGKTGKAGSDLGSQFKAAFDLDPKKLWQSIFGTKADTPKPGTKGNLAETRTPGLLDSDIPGAEETTTPDFASLDAADVPDPDSPYYFADPSTNSPSLPGDYIGGDSEPEFA